MHETTFNLGEHLTPEMLLSIGSRECRIVLDEETQHRVEQAHTKLTRHIESGEQVYGITTGFGPLVDRNVDHDSRIGLQLNLLQQLGCNVGPALPPDIVRAIIAIRARALAVGASGIRSRVLNSLVDLVNSGATPVIRRFGSVGASGDLVPLASMARCLAGWDSIRMPDGRVNENSPQTLAELGVDAFSPQPKEALALVNGTSFSSGITAVSTARMRRCFHETVLPLVATSISLLDGSTQYLDAEIYRLKPHKSAIAVSETLRRLLDTRDPANTPSLPQPPYSTRSAVLWYGAAFEDLNSASDLLETELNSVDDNPLVSTETQRLLHAANFQGTYVALAADKLCGALARMATGIERLVNRILHDAHNGALPAFLASEPIGLHSGLQGYQLLATSLTADIRARAVPHAATSIPTNADNQDVVSMSANAALNALELSDRFAQLCAVSECVFARAVSIAGQRITPTLTKHWNERPELLEADFSAGDLAALVDSRHLAIWNGQPV
ncbi:MAG: aromatic amino acid ammonia-lyase [Spirochaetia bacterium]